MRPLRRPQIEARVEMMPLIDVIFLLITFFLYAMVLMVRAEVLPMETPELATGTEADTPPAITVSLDEQGNLYVDRAPTTLDELVPTLRELVGEQPGAIVYLAAADQGDVDRLPLFIDLYDQLAGEGLDLRLVGRARSEEP